MPASYSIDPERRLVTIRVWGVFTNDDFRDVREWLLSEPLFHPTYRQLADLTEVSEVEVSHGVIASFAHRPLFAPGVDRAFVGTTAAHFGVARLIGLYAEAVGQRLRVFRDRSVAESWLGV